MTDEFTVWFVVSSYEFSLSFSGSCDEFIVEFNSWKLLQTETSVLVTRWSRHQPLQSFRKKRMQKIALKFRPTTLKMSMRNICLLLLISLLNPIPISIGSIQRRLLSYWHRVCVHKVKRHLNFISFMLFSRYCNVAAVRWFSALTSVWAYSSGYLLVRDVLRHLWPAAVPQTAFNNIVDYISYYQCLLVRQFYLEFQL